MTAEAVVMNKSAVALAADSAVTIRSSGGNSGYKIFNTANKIFSLCRRAPVAVMIYGNAELVGVPWETVIKEFRSSACAQPCATLGGYAEQFTGFLSGFVAANPEAYPSERQGDQVFYAALQFLSLVKGGFESKAKKMLARQDGMGDDDIKAVLANICSQHHERYRKAAWAPQTSLADHRQLKRDWAERLKQARTVVLEQLPLSPKGIRQLNDVIIGLFTKEWFLPSEIMHMLLPVSGVVLAGFGDAEVFPRVRECLVTGVVGDRVRYQWGRDLAVSPDNAASIIPFAQQEMAFRFMEGVDPSYQDALERDLLRAWPESLAAVIESIGELDAERKAHYRASAAQIGSEELRKYVTRLKEYRKDKYVRPVLEIVASLPKEELAEMAEALVNLTSLKRKMSRDMETVGGPIDVAVISKGDGLVWIKRKHYFRRELNPSFMSRYYPENSSDHDYCRED